MQIVCLKIPLLSFFRRQGELEIHGCHHSNFMHESSKVPKQGILCLPGGIMLMIVSCVFVLFSQTQLLPDKAMKAPHGIAMHNRLRA